MPEPLKSFDVCQHLYDMVVSGTFLASLSLPDVSLSRCEKRETNKSILSLTSNHQLHPAVAGLLLYA